MTQPTDSFSLRRSLWTSTVQSIKTYFQKSEVLKVLETCI
jgi:hypothetical protein